MSTEIKTIKFDSVREILSSGNVWNCQKKPIIVQCKQMLEDFEIETLESGNGTFKGKNGDYIMIGASGEMYVCDKDVFESTYDVKNEWNIRQYAKDSEEYHSVDVYWNDTPFSDNKLKLLRLKKIQKEIKGDESPRNY